jgi:hypothetical protein
MRNSLTLLVLLAALACMSGCSIAPPKTIVQVIAPPDAYLQDCAHAPRPADNTVNGAMQGIANERAVVESCDWADKAALRAWKAGVTASGNKLVTPIPR